MATTKTLKKKFHSFEKEEHWLNDLAQHGWRLTSYSNDEVEETQYTFEHDPSVKGMTYKIDFRPMKDKDEFNDYVTIFEESGWQSIAPKHTYWKYIFISKEGTDIYSDASSLVEREKQRRKIHIINLSVFLVINIVCIIFYSLNGHDWLVVSAIFSGILALYNCFLIWKSNKTMKSIRG